MSGGDLALMQSLGCGPSDPMSLS